MVLIDNVCIPHAWYSVETDVNDRIYMYFSYTSGAFGVPISIAMQIPPGNYSGTLFANEIQSLINLQLPGTLKVTYNAITSNITISTYDSAPINVNFQILTDADCATKLNGLFTLPVDTKNPRTANDIEELRQLSFV